MAALIKERLDAGLDFFNTKTQYGFRKGKSTSHAIFLARRILDISEQRGSNMSMILLDWEKALDKIEHTKLMEALERLNIPKNLLKMINNIYTAPKFRVKVDENVSEYKTQRTGIRQGCPLSPYLFILVMSVMFRDIKTRMRSP